MKIVCIGDSLVTGFPYEPSQSWVAHFRAASGHTVLNRGVNGDSAAWVRSRFSRDVLSESPDSAFILCGTNDFIFQTSSPEEAMETLGEMVSLCREHKIFPALMTPLPLDVCLASAHWVSGINYETANENIAILRRLMQEYAAKTKTALFDLYGFYAGLLTPDMVMRLFWDGIHPSTEGHRAIAHFVTDRAKELLPA